VHLPGSLLELGATLKFWLWSADEESCTRGRLALAPQGAPFLITD
jgi:hypothetical protein